MSSEHRQSNTPKFLCGVVDRSEDQLCFPSALFAACDAEDAHGGKVCRIPRCGYFRKWKISSDGNESRLRWNRREPGKFFGRNRKDCSICKIQRTAHGA